jgi:Rrf2 family protein
MAKVVTLSEAASIGLHGMILVARANHITNVTTISEATQSSRHHVAKVMQRLVKDDLLTSLRGPNGGFSLKKDPKEITLLNIYESIEGKIEITSCPLDKPICPFGKCILENVAQKMTREFKDYLSGHTLESYLQ